MSQPRNSLPTFSGREDPDTYFDWELRMNNFFETVNYSEEKKVSIATAQLTNIALSWWERELRNNYYGSYFDDTTWKQMKAQLWGRFKPEDWRRDLYKRLRRLSQGRRTVKNYYDEFKILRDRLGWEMSEENFMNHFLDGLQERIARRVERLYYRHLDDLFHLATQVEQRLEEKTPSSRRNKTTLEPSKSLEGAKEEYAGSKQIVQETVPGLPKLVPLSIPVVSVCETPKEVVIPTQENEPTLLLVSMEEGVGHQPKEIPSTNQHTLEKPHSKEPLAVLPVIQGSSNPSPPEGGLFCSLIVDTNKFECLDHQVSTTIVGVEPVVLEHEETTFSLWGNFFQEGAAVMIDELGRSLDFSRINHIWALVVISAQTANPWSHEGSSYLQVPFDPGKLQFPSSN